MRGPALRLLVVVSAVGCGGHALSSEAVRSDASQAGQIEERKIELGREIFTEIANPPCAACHTLAEAGAAGTTGPNLDEERPAEADVELTVTEGVGVMPAYGELLTEEQIEAVAKYVSSAAGAEGD